MNFRVAAIHDIPFLVETIIEAEKSSSPVLSYNTVFGLSESQATHYLTEMLNEEVDHCELSVSSFLVAEDAGSPVGAVSGWVEGVEGVPSSVLKGNLLSYVLPKTCLEQAAKLYPVLQELNIDYVQGSIQKGAGYVIGKYRGQGILKAMTEELIERLVALHPEVRTVYTQIYGNNFRAINANLKAGFEIVVQKTASNKAILKYLPSDSKVMMKKNLIIN